MLDGVLLLETHYKRLLLAIVLYEGELHSCDKVAGLTIVVCKGQLFYQLLVMEDALGSFSNDYNFFTSSHSFSLEIGVLENFLGVFLYNR